MFLLKHHYHVLTPLGRLQQVPRLAKSLAHPCITWHPLVESDLLFWISGTHIHSFMFHRSPEGWHPAHYAVNQFIEYAPIRPEDRYLILPDDDDYGEGFWEKIDSADGDLVIASMNRPGMDFLEAKSDNLQFGRVGAEQICLTGELLRPSRFQPARGGDWPWIESLCKKQNPVFVPDATVHFNTHS